MAVQVSTRQPGRGVEAKRRKIEPSCKSFSLLHRPKECSEHSVYARYVVRQQVNFNLLKVRSQQPRAAVRELQGFWK